MSSDSQDGNLTNNKNNKNNHSNASEDTIPLKNAENINDSSKDSLAKDQSSSATIDINDESTKVPKRNRFKGTYDDVLRNLEISEKSRFTFLILLVIIILLILVVIILSILWPNIPSYLKYPVCNSKICLESSYQILSWSDQNVNSYKNTCEQPYQLTCGHFADEFQKHELYNKYKGEWNVKSYYKYKEITEINNFITKQLVNSTGNGVFIKELYNSCMRLGKVEQESSMAVVKRVLRSLGGWRIIDDGLSKWNLNKWTIQEALPILHEKYGVSLFFKVSIREREVEPYGKMISISEGDFGLPHKDLYLIDDSNEVIKSYKELLANIFKLFDRTSEEAKKFARQMYNYEKRVVKDAYYLNKEVPSTGEIITLGRLKTEISSLAVYETIKVLFSKTRLTDDTQIWVHDLDKLKETSRIVSSTESSILNDIVTWSVLRPMLPFLSKKFQNVWEQFLFDIYDVNAAEPIWYSCTETINKLAPIGIEVARLQNNPQLLDDIEEATEYVTAIFDSIKDTLSTAINDAIWINDRLSQYLISNLGKMTLQIGIPRHVVENDRFVESFYSDYLPQTINFVENIEQHWAFEKTLLEKQLGELQQTDELLLELYPPARVQDNTIRYFSNLNQLVVKSSLLRQNYFNKDYPVVVNFARIGTEIAEALIAATQQLSYRYSKDVSSSKPLSYGDVIEENSIRCLAINKHYDQLPSEALRDALTSLSATKITRTTVNNVITKIKKGDEKLTNILQKDLRRLPALRHCNDLELFDIVLLQRHCSATNEKYQELKPFVEYRFSEKTNFGNIWNIAKISNGFDCDVKENNKKCENLF